MPGAFPRFDCPACGRRVASVYADAVHVAQGRHYAYLREHKGTAGARCLAQTTGTLATVLRAK